jgi:hypothetical protein
MSARDPSIPLVCNMNVFSPAERELHLDTTTRLLESLQDVQEVQNGFRFSFPAESDAIMSLAGFLRGERLCCPFLEFDLKVSAGDGPITLLLTGPEGTQEFLRSEFGEALG